jgi:small subunit ribosomal protein S16
MVKIRLARYGTRKRAYYRVVAADGRSKRDGAFLELLGTYDPSKNPALVTLDMARINFWLEQGAQPSATAENLIRSARRSAEATQ